MKAAPLAVGDEPAFRLTVHNDRQGAAFSPTMHGIFFEDINYAADGGLYAELVQNRSFEHRNPLYAWSATDDAIELKVASESGLHEQNPVYAHVSVPESAGQGGVINTGFDGFAIQTDARYLAALHVRGESPAEVMVVLRNAEGTEVASATLGTVTAGWKRLEGELNAGASAEAATLEVRFSRPGEYDLDVVSLFPADTFRGRRNGLRKDLAQLIADMKPTFVRFPGGCIVEGRTLDNAYRWKDGVGPIWERQQNYNLWSNRETPQYHQTYGLGFFEFFQFCEDIGAEAVPIVNCGMACQARRGAPAPMDELEPWVDDALDLVEFANGPTTSEWGRLRAEMGHPEPFNLKYLGVGNEQWMEGYFERYQVFHQALRKRYPDLQIISTSGPQANDQFYQYAWSRFHDDVQADIVDEHYYRPPQWFLSNSERYDGYDRNGPKVFAGEFAAHEPNRESTLRAAVSEAAFMTGLWRNADVVTMSSYAPLFARVGSVQWAPDLIWFDNARSFGTPSYYVQAMYGQHVPDTVAPVTLDADKILPEEFRGRVGLGTWETQAEYKEVRVTRGDEVLYESGDSLDEWDLFGGDWSIEEGVIRQNAGGTNVRAFVGDESWTDYTLTLKARKLGGSEGFLVSFASTNPNQTSWWNLGGWVNTEHGLEAPRIPLTRTRGRIEEDRWYDIRIDVGSRAIVCYLDGKEVQRAEVKPTPSIFAAAGVDRETDEVVIAVANPGESAHAGRIALATGSAASASVHVLTSDSPLDVNSLDEPTHVAPQESEVTATDGVIEYEFPACSFTVLRVEPSGE